MMDYPKNTMNTSMLSIETQLINYPITAPITIRFSSRMILKFGRSPLRGIGKPNLQLVKEYPEENLTKNNIASSSTPYSLPILFVKKADGGLQFYVDYRKLDKITKKDRYPLPLITKPLA